jgi:hypothetical protein
MPIPPTFANIKCCKYAKLYTNKVFWIRSQFKKICYNVVISERIQMSVGGIGINTSNYKSAAIPRFAEHW